MSDNKDFIFSYDRMLLEKKFGKQAFIIKIVRRGHSPQIISNEQSEISIPFSSIDGVVFQSVSAKWEDGIVRTYKITRRAESSEYVALIGFRKQQAA